MRYEIKAVLSNAQHPEYGQTTMNYYAHSDVGVAMDDLRRV